MNRWRLAASFYGVAFLLASAAAPHRHLDETADLFSDERSDSGIFVREPAPGDRGGEPCWTGATFVIDAPCLACFQHDFVSAFSSIVSMPVPVRSAHRTRGTPRRCPPAAEPRLRASRSPPVSL